MNIISNNEFLNKKKKGNINKMYSIIEHGGKQYKVAVGNVLYFEKIAGEMNDEIIFDKILFYSDEKNLTQFGKPFLDNINIYGKIIKHGKKKKILVFKYKAKKGYKKLQGHRQLYTKVEITKIEIKN